MTGREKIEAAFSPQGTPEIAAVICYESIFFRDHYAQLTRQPWWAQHSGDLDMHLAMHRDFIRSIGQDWYRLPLGPSRYERENIGIEERADGVYRVDRRTGVARRLQPRAVSGWDGRRLHSPNPAQPPRTRAEIDARHPLPTRGDIEQPFQNGATDLTRILLESDLRDIFPHGNTSSPLWSGCYGLWSFEEMMCKFVEEPDLIHYACQRRLQRLLPYIEQQARLGARALWIEECMTDMISPAAYREFNLPYLRQIIGAIREAGMYSIYYYCGDPSDRLDLILASGADAIALEESKKGWRVDIEEVVDFVRGRTVLLGNLDAIHLLECGSEEQLCAEIKRQIAAGRRNRSRFIMSVGSPITPGTSVERVRRYCEMVHELGGGR